MDPFVKQMADTVIDGEPALSAKVVSFFQGFGEIARMTGYLAGGFVSDRLGRKYVCLQYFQIDLTANLSRRATMFIAIVVLLGGNIAEILVNHWQGWLGAQFMVKFGVGLATSTLIVYVSEIAPFQIRGFMVGSYQLFLAGGQLVSSIATKILTVTRPNVWRPLIATEFLFVGVSALGHPLFQVCVDIA